MARLQWNDFRRWQSRLLQKKIWKYFSGVTHPVKQKKNIANKQKGKVYLHESCAKDIWEWASKYTYCKVIVFYDKSDQIYHQPVMNIQKLFTWGVFYKLR